MVKSQIHETFKSFKGTSIPEVSKTVSDFVSQNKLAPKSLSVLNINGSFLVTIGYRTDETGYAVSIENLALNFVGSAMVTMTVDQLDDRINQAEDVIPGDVICQSLFVNNCGMLEVAFLIHG